MSVVALSFSWDMCSVLHDWVWAGQSNRIPVDLWFGIFSWFVFSFTRISHTFWVSAHTSDFANATSEESPVGESWECEGQKKSGFLSLSHVFFCQASTCKKVRQCVHGVRGEFEPIESQQRQDESWLSQIQTETSKKAEMCYRHAHAYAHSQICFLPEVLGVGRVHCTMLRIHLLPSI